MSRRSRSGCFHVVPFALVALLGCDTVNAVRTSAGGSYSLDASCASEALRTEFPGAEVSEFRLEAGEVHVVVLPAPNSAFTVGPMAPRQGEIKAEFRTLRKPTTDNFARMEALERRALLSVLARCAHTQGAQLSCWSSFGPVSGETCFLRPPSVP